MYQYNESVFIHSGKYLSFIGSFVRYSDCGKFAIVDVDLAPEPVIRRIRLKKENISSFKH